MTRTKTALISAAIAVVIGFIAGFMVAYSGLFKSASGQKSAQSANDESKPLYWVAPMDPNYRRDGPGKSPMGMDLIPVYKNEGDAQADAGVVSVSPEVINTLGVRTGEVEFKPLHSETVTVAYVQYDENQLVHIHPRVSGWVEKLHVKAAGDPVVEGQALYALYSPELVNAQEELLLAINRKSPRLIEAAEDRLKALQISEHFIAALKQNSKVKQTVNFYAPQSGVVDNLNIREGFFVQPGTTILSIGALDHVWVEAEIFERQAPMVSVGDPVLMTLDYLPGRQWQGKIDYIYPALDAKTRTVRLRIGFANPDHALKPNMFAQISISSDSVEPALVIPREALIRSGAQDRVVLALGAGRFKSLPVKVGRVTPEYVEILDGLEKGEKIVSSAQFLLDSESNKNADFKRMHAAEELVQSIWVAAEIQEQFLTQGKVRVSHEPMTEWNMPAMTMNFKVASSVDIHTLMPGTQLHMQVQRDPDGYFEIIDTHILRAGAANESRPHDRDPPADQGQGSHAHDSHSHISGDDVEREHDAGDTP